MNTLKISSYKIYARLLLNIDNQNTFPKHFFNPKSVLYTTTKKEPYKEFGVVNIKDSIHYKYVNNNVGYSEIYNNYLRFTEQYDHNILKFNTLIANFNLEELERNKVVLKKVKYKKRTHYEIVDGCHRLSIYFIKFNKLQSDFYRFSDS